MMARIIVESMRRLYRSGKITKEQVFERVEKGIITWDEYGEITDDEPQG